MRDPERPLDPKIAEQVNSELHALDVKHWPIIAALKVAKYIPPLIPVPPHRPLHLRDCILSYAVELFETEAANYEHLRRDAKYPVFLLKLADRVHRRVVKAIENIEEGDQSSTFWYHGISYAEVVQAVQMRLWTARTQRTQQGIESYTEDQEGATPSQSGSAAPNRQRMSATIHSPSAARKMEVHMNARGLNQTEFAVQAGTTDKTIRKFRQTGDVKRSILEGIADAMGTSKQELLK